MTHHGCQMLSEAQVPYLRRKSCHPDKPTVYSTHAPGTHARHRVSSTDTTSLTTLQPPSSFLIHFNQHPAQFPVTQQQSHSHCRGAGLMYNPPPHVLPSRPQQASNLARLSASGQRLGSALCNRVLEGGEVPDLAVREALAEQLTLGAEGSHLGSHARVVHLLEPPCRQSAVSEGNRRCPSHRVTSSALPLAPALCLIAPTRLRMQAAGANAADSKEPVTFLPSITRHLRW